MLSAGCSRVWILPPLLPHTRVRAGGYLPTPPFAVLEPSSTHSCSFLPSPPTPTSLLPLPSLSPHAVIPSSRAGWVLSVPPCAARASHTAPSRPPLGCDPSSLRCGAVPAHGAVRCCCAPRETKNYSDPSPASSSRSPLLLDMLGRPLRAPVPPAPPAPTVAPPPLRALLARRENR